MGRTTPSQKLAFIEEFERIKKLIERLPEKEREIWIKALEDVEETYNLYSDISISDPLEIIIIHILRKLLISGDN